MGSKERREFIDSLMVTREVVECPYCDKIWAYSDNELFPIGVVQHIEDKHGKGNGPGSMGIREYAEMEQGLADLQDCGDK